MPLGGYHSNDGETHTMLKRTLAVAGLVVVAIVALTASVAQAQQYPPAVNFITVSDSTPFRGQSIVVTSGTYAAGADVDHELNSAPVFLGTAVADADGIAQITVTIPTNTTLGEHTIVASGLDNDRNEILVLSATITVVDKDTPCFRDDDDDDEGRTNLARTGDEGGTSLARTGDDFWLYARLGLGAVAAGAMFVLVARKRRDGAVTA
ncbi:hypothetical protein BH18ACT4_BH18ACT4_08810 [soil metagenome]